MRGAGGASLALPQAVDADPRRARVHAALLADRRPLWPSGPLALPHVPWTPGFARAVHGAWRRGQVVLGFERAEAVLASERAGLALLRARGQRLGTRVSRLLLLARDGSSRLARQVERLAREHGARLLVLAVDVTAAELASVVGAEGRRVKLVLVTHRQAVAAVLLGLA